MDQSLFLHITSIAWCCFSGTQLLQDVTQDFLKEVAAFLKKFNSESVPPNGDAAGGNRCAQRAYCHKHRRKCPFFACIDVRGVFL